jgi:hypothetical protein
VEMIRITKPLVILILFKYTISTLGWFILLSRP